MALNVSAIADIALAGQPNGTLLNVTFGCSSDSALLNSPVEAGLQLTPGQAVEFSSVTGAVDLEGNTPPLTPPDGETSFVMDTPAAFGLSTVRGPAGALVGVFLGPDRPSSDLAPLDLNFSGSAREMPVLYPLLQQPFYIGRGLTSEGLTKSFIIPSGATRLFLGVLERNSCNSNNSGSFSVTANVAPPPAPPLPGEARVFGGADITLAGQPNGTPLPVTFGCTLSDSAVLNAPVNAGLTLTPGQAVQFTSVTGNIDLEGNLPPTIPPDGDTNFIMTTPAAFGLSAVHGPAGALVGVFLSNDAPSGVAPPDLDFSSPTARDVARLEPLLHQVFYLGRGKTSAGTFKKIIVPTGATRLFLGVLDINSCNSDNSGWFSVTVAVEPPSTSCPTVSSLNPASGKAGANVTITGANLTGVTAVKFSNNLTAVFSVNGSGTQITTSVPNGAVTGPITISSPNCSDAQTSAFSVLPDCLTVSSISPTTAAAGSQVIITGTGFTGVTSVKFANNVEAPLTVNSDTKITVTVTCQAASGPLTLSKPGGCNSLQTPSLQISNPFPTTTTISPTQAMVGGSGFTLTVNGANFIPCSEVRWNGSKRTTTFVSSTKLTAEIPTTDLDLTSATTVTVKVTVFNPGPGGGISNPAENFTIKPRVLRAANASGTSGRSVSVPIEVDSAGDVNALGFSLTFNPDILSNPQAALSSGVSAGALLINPSQTAQGHLGLGLALPAGQKIAAGTQQIIIVSFTIAAGITFNSTTVSFGDLPVGREASDVNANALLLSYDSGTVTIKHENEADVSPRPTGSNDGRVKITDWVQVCRFAAGLETANPGAEFQRADAAPRETLGDGKITAADCGQAGRYATGLDPVTAAGGPTSPMPAATSAILAHAPEVNLVSPRLMRLVSSGSGFDQTRSLTLELEAQGNENSLGLSLLFNPSEWRFVKADVGSGASGAALYLNANQAASGRVGLVLALPAGQTLTGGVRQLVVFTFVAVSGGNARPISFGFGDQPVAREVADASANSLATTYAHALANVSAASFRETEMASEAIVSAFGTALATATQPADRLPLPTELAGTSVTIKDSQGAERRAPLFFVSPGQVNYQIPPGTATGTATVTITSGEGSVSTGVIEIAPVAPSLFAANASGQGAAAAIALRVVDGVSTYEPVAEFDAAQNQFVARPLDLGPETDQVFLMLFGTGLRHRSDLSAVRASIGNEEAEVLYAGPQGDFAGLDQINLRVPRSLAGRGEIEIVLMADGKLANTVRVNLK